MQFWTCSPQPSRHYLNVKSYTNSIKCSRFVYVFRHTNIHLTLNDICCAFGQPVFTTHRLAHTRTLGHPYNCTPSKAHRHRNFLNCTESEKKKHTKLTRIRLEPYCVQPQPVSLAFGGVCVALKSLRPYIFIRISIAVCSMCSVQQKEKNTE